MTSVLKNFEGLARDENSQSIQIGSSFVTVDANDTVSPWICSGEVDAVAVPINAVEFIVYPESSALSVSEDTNMNSYDKVAQGSKESFPCARMDTIYIEGVENLKVYFRFTIV